MTINASQIVVRISALCFLTAIATSGSAQYFSSQFHRTQQAYDVRHYYGYPYHYSVGPRYDPYWSYNSSYFPETYQGDGSYYGIGYSGYNGNGWYGSYYYW